ncbi:DUF2268 domain-containing putative Zn-dependent protease [bacterium]
MRRFNHLPISGSLIILMFWCHSHAQLSKYLSIDPFKAPFVYEDIENINRAFQMITRDSDTLKILQVEYLDKGTPGLKMFVEKYDLTAERMRRAIRKYRSKYAVLSNMPDLLAEKVDEYREAFANLKKYIPNAVFPTTYFLVGGHRGIGSGSLEGQLMSVEKWIPPIEYDKKASLVHELVHFQQAFAVGYEKYAALFGSEKSLLGLCIREGTAEFFAHLATGIVPKDETLAYVRKHEKRLWEWFKKEMYGRDTGEWMWSSPSDPEQPRDVGYEMGYVIVEAYFNNAEDKIKAARDILSVTDFPAFLEESGYSDRFQ